MLWARVRKCALSWENRSENRSHRNEMPGKDDIERIVRDMKNFERGK